MYKTLTLLSLFALSITGYSQKMGMLGLGEQNNAKYHTVPQQIGLEGNINYFDEYQPGKVYFRDSTFVDVPLLNYNLLQNKVTLKINSDEFFLPNENSIDSFKIAHKTFVIRSKISFKPIFCEVLYNSKNLELIKQSKAQIVTGKEGTGMTPTTPDRVKITSHYYLYKDNNFYELELNKTELYDLLGHNVELDKYRKANRLKFKNEEDLVALIAYYNQLENL